MRNIELDSVMAHTTTNIYEKAQFNVIFTQTIQHENIIYYKCSYTI